jgi:malonyl CoA-acyl carrier protein transacylase
MSRLCPYLPTYVRCPKYTFSHPGSLLFATQSAAQLVLVVTEKAAFEDMRVKGSIQKDCAFAGHSLGEYSALASIADVLGMSFTFLPLLMFVFTGASLCNVQWNVIMKIVQITPCAPLTQPNIAYFQ